MTSEQRAPGNQTSGAPNIQNHAHAPLRVCHLAYTFYETDNRVMRYAKALVARGDTVDVIGLRRPRQPRSSELQGVTLLRLQYRTKSEGAAWMYLLKILLFIAQAAIVLSIRQLRKRYDIVHVHNVPDFLVFAAIVPKLLGAKIILDIHDILPELYAGKFGVSAESPIFRCLLFVERLASRFADHTIVANHLWHARLVMRSVASEKCSTILNYPDLRLFKPRPRQPHAKSEVFRILYPGSLSRHQGLEIAIRAFAKVATDMPSALFEIYGEGQARLQLEQLIRQLKLVNRVLIHDPVPVEDVAALMSAADLGVEPKLALGFSDEALSTKVLEFMASGVPVLLSRTTVHAHYFDPSVVSFFSSGDYEGLANSMLTAYNMRDSNAARISDAMRFAAQYDWHKRVADYYDLVDSECVSSAGGRSVGIRSAQ